jgi:uncharacterized protein with PIN domain
LLRQVEEDQTQQELRGQVPNREMVEVEELLGLMQPLIAVVVVVVGKEQAGNPHQAARDWGKMEEVMEQ